jgi:hypothetical protein
VDDKSGVLVAKCKVSSGYAASCSKGCKRIDTIARSKGAKSNVGKDTKGWIGVGDDCETNPCVDGNEGASELRTNEEFFNESWASLFCIRAEMISNICDAAEVDSIEFLMMKNSGGVHYNVRQMSLKIISGWRAAEYVGKSFEDLLMALNWNDGGSAREKIGCIIKSLGWVPEEEKVHNELQWKKILKIIEINYANCAIGLYTTNNQKDN